MSIERVATHDHRVGEGPLYHPDDGVVYWTDIPSGRLFQYDPATGDSQQVLSVDRTLGGFTLQADGSLALFLGAGGVAVWDGDDLEYVLESIPGEEHTRFNDVVADPRGRVFAGTMPTDDGPGHLYRIHPDGRYERADEDGYRIPNGMGFTLDRRSMYVTESERRAIYRFAYDQATGALSEKAAWVEIAGSDADAGSSGESDAVPDGMTVDAAGNVWSARWNGGEIVRYAPDGTVVDRIAMPVAKVTAVTFGGDQYDDLYVTTAAGHDAEDDPPAGSLFRVDVDATGVPEFRSRIGR